MKLGYDLICERVFRLWSLIAIANLTDSLELQDYFQSELDLYLSICGWDEAEFNNETLNTIDSNWIDTNLN